MGQMVFFIKATTNISGGAATQIFALFVLFEYFQQRKTFNLSLIGLNVKIKLQASCFTANTPPFWRGVFCIYIHCASLAMTNLQPQLFYLLLGETAPPPPPRCPLRHFSRQRSTKVTLLISNIFGFLCEMYYPRHLRGDERRMVGAKLFKRVWERCRVALGRSTCQGWVRTWS